MSENPFSRSEYSWGAKRFSAEGLTLRESFTAPRNLSSQKAMVTSRNFRSPEGLQPARVQMQAQLKKKYQRMVELQHRSFVQRHQLEKQREQFLKKSQEMVQTKAKEIREQLCKLGQSTRELQFRHRCQGAELRQQRLINHRYCIQRDNNDLVRKKQAVSKRHRSFRIDCRLRRGAWAQGEKIVEQNWPLL